MKRANFPGRKAARKERARERAMSALNKAARRHDAEGYTRAARWLMVQGYASTSLLALPWQEQSSRSGAPKRNGVNQSKTSAAVRSGGRY